MKFDQTPFGLPELGRDLYKYKMNEQCSRCRYWNSNLSELQLCPRCQDLYDLNQNWAEYVNTPIPSKESVKSNIKKVSFVQQDDQIVEIEALTFSTNLLKIKGVES